MVKSIKVILYLFDLLTSAGSRVILQLIKFVWIFTAVCYFSPHNDLTRVIVWLFFFFLTGYRPVLRLPRFELLQIAGVFFQLTKLL